jgi:pre-60S factor REI1
MAAATTEGVAAAAAGRGFTCVTCHVAFHTADDQRTHYRTDWHRYNLKRKVAAMPPVSRADFNGRVLAQQAKEQSEAEQAQYTGHCDVCKYAAHCTAAMARVS